MRYFDMSEFNCQETGNCKMSPLFLERLDELRHRCGFPFTITSGYRDPEHSIERSKTTTGKHTKGIAVDIKVTNGAQKYIILLHALSMGFTGIGIADTFIHVDDRKSPSVVWTYK